MSWQVVRVDSAAPQAWRNGGGVTRELLAWPNADDWSVRLSVADIERDGPFSAFAGVDRWFAVLSGAGVLLGNPVQTVRRHDGAINFAGESAPDCHLINGATRDLNLMIRRDRATGWLRALHSTEVMLTARLEASASPTAVLHGVFSVGGGELRPHASEVVVLPPMSLAWQATTSASVPASFRAVTPDTGNFEFHCVVSNSREQEA